MNLRHKDIISLVILTLITLLPSALSQAVAQGSLNNNNNNNGNQNVNAPSSTVKTTTIRTEAPTTRPSQKTTLRPQQKTTERALPEWEKTTNKHATTKNYNLLFTTLKPWIGPTPDGGYPTGSSSVTCYHTGLLMASVSVFLMIFHWR